MNFAISRHVRFGILWFAALAVIALVATRAPIAQSGDYHDFVDTRSWLGIPNFWNVMSNVPFLFVGVLVAAAAALYCFAVALSKRIPSRDS